MHIPASELHGPRQAGQLSPKGSGVPKGGLLRDLGTLAVQVLM